MIRAIAAAKRPWLALLLAMQLVGTTVPFADARLEGGDGGPVHIEARTEHSCHPVHLDGDCLLCQHLSRSQALAAPSVACEGAEPVRIATVHRAIAPFSSVPAFMERGRSPPTVEL